MSSFDSPRLIADIGVTYARFALEAAPGRFEQLASLRCAEYQDFQSAVEAYLAGVPTPRPRHAAIAIANPVEGDQVRMTNYPWQFSIEETRRQLALDALVVVNDFTALAMALPRLGPGQRRQVGGGAPRERSVIGLIGAGTGLGVSSLVPTEDGWIALGSEGGHASLAPRDEREIDILRYAMIAFRHVSSERLLSGPGLSLILRALQHRQGLDGPARTAPEITRLALDGADPLCVEALDAFCALLGTAASDLALTQGAMGGIYIGGGIVPRLGTSFDRSPFRGRFEDKGRFSGYLKAIPTYVITDEQATLIGASAILSDQLRALQARSASAILEQIQRTRARLSPAERRVADHVLAHPRAALNDPIASIARAAEVSQPTVIRFCRSLGCEGLSDFKLRLASGLTATVPVTHAQVTGQDTPIELGAKVLGNTASAILQLRDQLNRETIDRAIDLLSAAGRVDFYAVGHYRVVADDAQFKFLRFGIASGSCTDSRLQRLTAAVLGPRDVAVVISSGGRIEDLLDVADSAHRCGAKVLAITAGQSPLARKADVALIVDHDEDLSTQVPMVSRVLHLLVVDILAVGVAWRRGMGVALPGDAAEALDESGPARAAGDAPQRGPDAGGTEPLPRMTSHSR